MKFSNREARKFVKASVVWFALMVGLMSFGAFAAEAAIKSKKAPRAAETYAATEAEDDASYNAKPVPITAAAPPPKLAVAQARTPIAIAGPNDSAAYDPVPSDQVASFMKRLQLVAVLLQRHGRAYDYRIHTVRQLETVLASMESAQAPSTSSASASGMTRSAPPRARAQVAAPPIPSEETSELPGA